MSPSSTVLLPGRAASMARRLLSGGGSASLVAYRHDAARSVGVLAHGLSSEGELVVAVPTDALPCDTDAPTEVRLDVRLEAPETRVRIIAASAHLLGQVEWVADPGRVALLADQALGPAAAVARVPEVALGVVRSDRVLLHDTTGVTPYRLADLGGTDGVPAFATTADELDVHEAVARLSAAELGALCAAVVEGRIDGEVLSERTGPVDPAAADQVFCVHVDDLGVDLMRVERDRTSVVFVAFPEQAGDVRDVRRQLATLRAHATC